MHVLFLAPDTHVYNHEFIRALKERGATVTALGPGPKERLSQKVRPYLSEYVAVRNLLDEAELESRARELHRVVRIDRVETIDEPLVVAAAKLRAALGLQGLSVRTAELCRDKSAMKEFLRARGIPCADSLVVDSLAGAEAFAEKVGYPIIAKPRAGFGSLGTYRIDGPRDLRPNLTKLRIGAGGSALLEEFIDGHEGFYDTLTVAGSVRHDFISHYYPGCLEAIQRRDVSPKIVHTNRVSAEGYQELRTMGARVNELLGIDTSATHMEWFFGSKGLRFSEIGARPAGEMIWDLYRVANDADVYREWAEAVLEGKTSQTLSRRYCTGAVQIRPSQDGRVLHYEGLERIRQKFGNHIYQSEIPPVGSATLPLEKGWHVNTWFRLRHPDYDTLKAMLVEIGDTVKVAAG
ncbi:MAG: ATPase [Candidatus Eisenbacteria bacterium]